MWDDIYKQMQLRHANLSKYACRDEEAIYLKKQEKDIRSSYFRDIDKIIYTLSFIRYQDKTQVWSRKSNDHIAKRMIHVQLVSKIARTIGASLGLNEDLIEAAALAHDLGHVPFGHEGEYILNDLSLSVGEGYFNHNIESVRSLLFIENYGQGLNISLQVLDAIMCHNGEFVMGEYVPHKKTKEDFFKEYYDSYQDKEVIKHLCPSTLEGCVVRISDIIAYLGRDIDDAIRLHILKKEELPTAITSVLGDNTKDIVNTCILDILKNSYNHNYLKFSDEVYQAIKDLKKFNYEHIYAKALTNEEKEHLKEMFQTLYNTYLKDIETNNMDSPINYSYLKHMVDDYKNNNTAKRIVIDYIAGMTDEYFIKEYERITNGNN